MSLRHIASRIIPLGKRSTVEVDYLQVLCLLWRDTTGLINSRRFKPSKTSQRCNWLSIVARLSKLSNAEERSRVFTNKLKTTIKAIPLGIKQSRLSKKRYLAWIKMCPMTIQVWLYKRPIKICSGKVTCKGCLQRPNTTQTSATRDKQPTYNNNCTRGLNPQLKHEASISLRQIACGRRICRVCISRSGWALLTLRLIGSRSKWAGRAL